jgi:hypothetical protein
LGILWDMFSGSCILKPWARAPLRLAPEAPERAATLAFRDATWFIVIAGISPDPAQAKAITAWAKEYWSKLSGLTAALEGFG